MHGSGGGEAFPCTIAAHYRTQLFEFPRVCFQGDSTREHLFVYESPSIHGAVVTDVEDYFVNCCRSKHYAISPCLRHEISQLDNKHVSKSEGNTRVYLVIEEQNMLEPVAMINGECFTFMEAEEKNGEIVPYLDGGRKDEFFIIAAHTFDGEWPTIPNNEDKVDMILAAVRVGQDSSEPIRRFINDECLATDDGRFVQPIRPKLSVRPSRARNMDFNALRDKVLQMGKAIESMESDIDSPHMALLVNAMNLNECKNDAFERLHYLRLWEALEGARKKHLGYSGSIRNDVSPVAGAKSLGELKKFRDDIAHWWRDSMDEEFLSDLYRTVNELLRRRYY